MLGTALCLHTYKEWPVTGWKLGVHRPWTWGWCAHLPEHQQQQQLATLPSPAIYSPDMKCIPSEMYHKNILVTSCEDFFFLGKECLVHQLHRKSGAPPEYNHIKSSGTNVCVCVWGGVTLPLKSWICHWWHTSELHPHVSLHSPDIDEFMCTINLHQLSRQPGLVTEVNQVLLQRSTRSCYRGQPGLVTEVNQVLLQRSTRSCYRGLEGPYKIPTQSTVPLWFWLWPICQVFLPASWPGGQGGTQYIITWTDLGEKCRKQLMVSGAYKKDFVMSLMVSVDGICNF